MAFAIFVGFLSRHHRSLRYPVTVTEFNYPNTQVFSHEVRFFSVQVQCTRVTSRVVNASRLDLVPIPHSRRRLSKFVMPLCFSSPLVLRFRKATGIENSPPSSPRRMRSCVCASVSQAPDSPRIARNARPTSPAASSEPLFQCPVCKTPLPPVAPLNLSELPSACSNCGSNIVQRSGFVDLTPNASASTTLLRNLLTQRSSQSLFQLPIVSFAYERGWRSGFKRAGFPGIDKEFDIFLDFAAPAATVLDMSCGSGLMSRRLATSTEFDRVVAADYSEAMLRQTVTFARRDVTVPEFDVVRADVARLPFVDNGFDAVHCGAALHCWPKIQDGLAEIIRVLKPGGKFFATTFLKLAYIPNRQKLIENPRLMNAAIRIEELWPGQLPYRFFEEDELEYLFKAAGFSDIDVETMDGCVIIRSQKPDSV